MKAVIAGGGIGGLTAALCLSRLGWQIEVLEQAPVLDAVGAGIQLSPNACRILDNLGILDSLRPQAFEPESLDMRWGPTGQPIFSVPLRPVTRNRWAAPYLHMHRADLIQGLRTALLSQTPEGLRTGITVHGYRQSSGKLQVHSTEGDIEADLLIGADGIHSVIREQMLGPQPARFTGNVAWRATVPLERLGHWAPPPSACVWAGPGRHAVTYRLQGGRLVNFVGVVEQQHWDIESWTEAGQRSEVLSDFAGWHPIITRLIEAADSHYRWALFDRPPLQRWSDGAVVLLGDACHPMLPFMAQGAAMAIEDAWALAQALAPGDDVDRALQAYYQQRFDRCRRVQRASAANQRRFHLSSPWLYAPLWLGMKLYPGLLYRQQDWLYRGGPLAAEGRKSR